MTVGVIVPVRNGERHVDGALESVLGQRPAAADVVVVDGGSTDATAAIARAKPGVRVIAQRGLGLAAGRNQGVAELDHACDLVAFCDSDDRWTPDALQRRVDHLAANPGVDAVIGRVVRRPLPGEPVPAGVRERLGVPMPGYTPGALVARRWVFEQMGGFDEDLHIGADTDWFVRLAQSDLTLALLDDLVLEKGVRVASLSNDIDAYREELLRVARAYVRRRRGAPRPMDGQG